MTKNYRGEFFGQIVFLIVGLFMMVKIMLPILSPASLAADLKYSQANFYQQILNKSTASMDTVMNSYEDEDRKDLFSIVFKYVTNIDLSNPKTYITSQIPVLDLIDISSIVAKEDEPIVVMPSDTKPDGDNKPAEEKPKPSTPGNQVNPANTPAPPKKQLNPSKPEVLIFHTHTREGFNPDGKAGKNFSSDLDTTICKVGDELKKELESKYGIAVIHDKTVHDYPIRDKAYEKSGPTVASYVKKYPNLKLIIDLHRDGGVSRPSATAMINGESYARTMFVVGSTNKGFKTSDALAQKMNGIFKNLYPGFSKGITYKKGKYNQQYSGNLVLLEVGSEQTSLEEAVRSVKVISRVVAEAIK